jgi:hypothetical protein
MLAAPTVVAAAPNAKMAARPRRPTLRGALGAGGSGSIEDLQNGHALSLART